jgi:parallel beta-helix repeat protein
VVLAVVVLSVAATSLPAAAMGGRRTWNVKPGQSIQATVDLASPGDTINVFPGDYVESPSAAVAVHVTKPLNLVAKSGKQPWRKVRILAAPGQHHGILVEPADPSAPDIDGLVIRGFIVEGFENNGIWLRHVKNFRIEENESVNNLENGIFPTLSANGLVRRNVAYGSQDSALWVEASQNVRVVQNELHHSPTGLEVTISNQVSVEGNNIHDNTIGVGFYHPATAGLPQAQWPPYWDAGQWSLARNWVHDNNEPNTASEGSETSQLPSGGGVLLLGVHDIDVDENLVSGNDFFGIAMVDYCLATFGTPFDCSLNPPPAATSVKYSKVEENKLVDNHAAPPPGPFQAIASDIVELWLEPDANLTNCFAENSIDNASSNPPRTIPDPLTPVCE